MYAGKNTKAVMGFAGTPAALADACDFAVTSSIYLQMEARVGTRVKLFTPPQAERRTRWFRAFRRMCADYAELFLFLFLLSLTSFSVVRFSAPSEDVDESPPRSKSYIYG